MRGTVITHLRQHNAASQNTVDTHRYISLVINNLEGRSSFFNKIAIVFSKITKARCVVNGYLCYGGDGTFGVHWDSHDVFALQIVGTKQWKVFGNSINFPVPENKYSGYKSECPNELLFSGSIKESDIFFIPRGCFHDVQPLDGISFHITIGVHKPRIVDFVQLSISKKYHLNEFLRRDYDVLFDRVELVEELTKTINQFENEVFFDLGKQPVAKKNVNLEDDYSVSDNTFISLDESILMFDHARNNSIVNEVRRFGILQYFDLEFLMLDSGYEDIRYSVSQLIKSGVLLGIDL